MDLLIREIERFKDNLEIIEKQVEILNKKLKLILTLLDQLENEDKK